MTTGPIGGMTGTGMASTLKRILCVEDEADIRTVAELALASVGGARARA